MNKSNLQTTDSDLSGRWTKDGQAEVEHHSVPSEARGHGGSEVGWQLMRHVVVFETYSGGWIKRTYLQIGYKV